MYPKLYSVGPFKIGHWSLSGFTVHSYGFMLMCAFIFGILWTLREARRKKLPSEQVLDLSILILVLGIIFARIVYILLNLHSYLPSPTQMLYIWQGGLSFHGGVAGGLLAAVLYAWRKKLKLRDLMDLYTPALPMAYAIARIGCFLRGCCYGIPTHLPWGCSFHAEEVGGALTGASHPVQLYDAAANVILFFIIGRLKGKDHASGVIFLQYLIGYSIIRSLAEFLRAGVTARVVFRIPLIRAAGIPITEAQVLSVLLIIACAVLIRLWSRKQPKPQPKR